MTGYDCHGGRSTFWAVRASNYRSIFKQPVELKTYITILWGTNATNAQDLPGGRGGRGDEECSLHVPNIWSIGWKVSKVEGRDPIDVPPPYAFV